LVSFCQSLRDLHGDFDRFNYRYRSRRDPVGKRRAVVESHHNKGLTIGGLLDRVDDANIRMIEGGGRSCLVEQPLSVVIAEREVCRKELKRNQAFELGI